MDRTTIKIDGQPLKFHFGVGFIGEAIKALDCTYATLHLELNNNPYRAIPVMLYEANRFACFMDNELQKHTLQDFYLLVDKVGIAAPEIVQFLQAFGKSRQGGSGDAEKKPKPAAKSKAGS